ncbi:hypothetical protein V6N13_098410 [Hibiscus sabdariffa]
MSENLGSLSVLQPFVGLNGKPPDGQPTFVTPSPLERAGLNVEEGDLRDVKKGRNQSSEFDGLHGDEQPGKVFFEVGARVADMDVQGYVHVVDNSRAVGTVEPASSGSEKLSYANMVAKNAAVTNSSSLSTRLPMDDVIVLEEDYIVDRNGSYHQLKSRIHPVQLNQASLIRMVPGYLSIHIGGRLVLIRWGLCSLEIGLRQSEDLVPTKEVVLPVERHYEVVGVPKVQNKELVRLGVVSEMGVHGGIEAGVNLEQQRVSKNSAYRTSYPDKKAKGVTRVSVGAKVVPLLAGSEVQVSCIDVRGSNKHTTIVIDDVLFSRIRLAGARFLSPGVKLVVRLMTACVKTSDLVDQMVVVSDGVDSVIAQDGVPRDLVQ